ncbi:MAG: DUF429 domain-containing protein [Pseudomonadota bacterium]
MSSASKYRPGLVAHADWSVDPAKRWITTAIKTAGRYSVSAAQLCPPPETLVGELSQQSPDSGVLLGFDFPTGLPQHLSEALRVKTFRDVLARLSTSAWPEFLNPAENLTDVAPTRPFFPARRLPKGVVTRAGLANALGAAGYDDLLRRCDRPSVERRATACLFFLIGGQQVGKAAIAGWRGLILPHHDDPSVALWPFDGDLFTLLAPRRTVLCETYPGEFTRPLGLPIGSGGRSKRRQADRQAAAAQLHHYAAGLDLDLSPELSSQIDDGFGPKLDGEDAFDSVVGLLGMLAVLAGRLAEGVPRDNPSVALEGWILGHAP